MSFIGSLFDPSKGAGYQAQGTNIQQPSTTAQANTAYNQTQQGLSNQQNFVNALQAQNGVGNQNAAYAQMQGVANGTGPNPAMNQLNQTTGQNTANTTAALASQRGSSANPAALARTAGLAGANNQQQAAGQAATMQAQQQLGAIGQLQGAAQNEVGNLAGANNSYNQAAQGQQSNILSGIAAQNNANVGMQNNINSSNAGVAGVNAQNQADMLGGLLGGAGVATGLLPKAHGGKIQKLAHGGVSGMPNGFDTGNVSSTINSDYVPYDTRVTNDQTAVLNNINKNIGGIGSDSSFKSKIGAHLGNMGNSSPMNNNPGYQAGNAVGAGIGKALGSIFGNNKPTTPSSTTMTPAGSGNQVNDTNMPDPNSPITSAHGGKVPALVSPGEKYLEPKEAKAVANGKTTPDKVGKMVPGKAKVKGDSLKNDTVKTTLEEGGCVIPRSVMNSDKPMQNAIKFVHAHMRMAKGGKIKKTK